MKLCLDVHPGPSQKQPLITCVVTCPPKVYFAFNFYIEYRFFKETESYLLFLFAGVLKEKPVWFSPLCPRCVT